ncbi:MAG: carboxypeptidase M32 [Planctomycetia bacterium]|nr:carboxypeptidase M32 [Planctomycetia bacterium]
MIDSTPDAYQKVVEHCRQTALLGSVSSVLGWDERTQMPVAASEHRAEQMTLLAGMIHQRSVDPQLGRWLEELENGHAAADSHSDRATNIRILKREYDKAARLPQALVEELTRTAVLGQHVWQKARETNDFELFRPTLEKTLELKRQEADALGYKKHRYDALLDQFEPFELTENVRTVLNDLRKELVPLVGAIAQSKRRAPIEILGRHFPAARQEAFGRAVAARAGFDFQRGRLDTTAHPFCSGLGPQDTRITTRYDERFFPSALFGILHEAGHGMYDQGLRNEAWGLPAGLPISLGIHESQSRLWENLVGRRRSFWQHFLPLAQQSFPESLSDVSLDEFHFAINDVRPSLIRVEADEATYNLHILIRFELELALLEGDLPVADLPAAWKARYREYLGIEPERDAEGPLQDIHWSFGAVGYFPTYSLGNLYASQFFDAAQAALGDVDAQFAAGDFVPLLGWLRENIHRPGQCYSASELVQRVTGKPLSSGPLLAHLRQKLGPLYDL